MVIRWIVAVVIIGLAGAYAAECRTNRSSPAKTPELQRVPQELSGWRGEDFPLSEQTAQVLAADATLRRCYRRGDGAEVWITVAYFAQQQVNSQIHSPRNCIPAEGWRVAALDQRRLNLGSGLQPASRMLVTRNGREQEVFYWFRTRGGTMTSEYALKWDLVKTSLARKPTCAAFIRYNAQLSDSGAVRELMSLMRSPLDRLFGEVGL